MEKPCRVDGCVRTLTRHSAKGLCNAHYQRWAVTGDPGPATIEPRRPGATCSVGGCARKAKSRGWCTGHYERWRRTGEVAGDLAPYNLTGNHEYTTAHTRTRKIRGRAADEQCLHCGGLAQQWAYDHLDPAEVWTIFKGALLAFSLDPDHYIPLCIRCHRVFDKSVRPAS